MERGHLAIPGEGAESPAAQINAWCEIAEEDAELGGDLVRKSLDAAVATVDALGDEGCEESHSSERYSNTRLYARIARTAWHLGQEPDYVRDILDKAASSVRQNQALGNYELQHLRLEKIAKTAHETGQDSDYLKVLIDRMREIDANVILGLAQERPERVADARVKQLDKTVNLSSEYGLGDEYIRGLFDAARERVQPDDDSVSPEALTAQVSELAGIASLADYWQDPSYIHEVIEQGRAIANLGANPEAFAELARAARVIAHAMEKPDHYIGDIIVEGLRNAAQDEERRPAHESLRELNKLLRAIYEPDSKLTEVLQNQITFRGMTLIEETAESPRQKHMLLNTLLSEVNLSEAVTTARGIDHRPLSYTYKPLEETAKR